MTPLFTPLNFAEATTPTVFALTFLFCSFYFLGKLRFYSNRTKGIVSEYTGSIHKHNVMALGFLLTL